MALYKFYNANTAGTQLYDICGTRYRRLLKACFLYSASVAMWVRADTELDMQHIASFRRKVTPPIKAHYDYYDDFTQGDTDRTNTFRLVRYLLTPDVKRFILNRTDSIFKWTCALGSDNPEDLVFFRPDGTVFFALYSQEGVCTLNPIEGEDISPILMDPHWREG